MSATIQPVLSRFRRQMLLLRFTQITAAGAFLLGMGGMMVAPTEWARRSMFLGLLALVTAWVLLTLRSLRIMRQVHAGGVLMSIGRLDDAEVWLRRGMSTFSLSGRVKILAGQLLGMVLLRQGAYGQVIDLCRALLRQCRKRGGRLSIEIRMLLADSLLRLDRLDEAGQVLASFQEETLWLEARQRLLPITLRYELATDNPQEAVRDLKGKLRIAELLDPPNAAFVHAMLAEACRRTGRTEQLAFLAERAALYHDLQPLAQNWPIIAPIVSTHPGDDPPADADVPDRPTS